MQTLYSEQKLVAFTAKHALLQNQNYQKINLFSGTMLSGICNFLYGLKSNEKLKCLGCSPSAHLYAAQPKDAIYTLRALATEQFHAMSDHVFTNNNVSSILHSG